MRADLSQDAHPCTNSPDHERVLTKYCTAALERVFEVNRQDLTSDSITLLAEII